MLCLTTGQKLELLEAVDELEDELDFLIVDTGAGISDNVLYFNLATQERLIVLTPEPTSLTDAYALIKVLKHTHGVEHFKVCVNMAKDQKNARDMFMRLYLACDHFLSGVSLDLVGMVPKDDAVRRAVRRQMPFLESDPDSPPSRAIRELAENISKWEAPRNTDGNIKFFWKKLLFSHDAAGDE